MARLDRIFIENGTINRMAATGYSQNTGSEGVLIRTATAFSSKNEKKTEGQKEGEREREGGRREQKTSGIGFPIREFRKRSLIFRGFAEAARTRFRVRARVYA